MIKQASRLSFTERIKGKHCHFIGFYQLPYYYDPFITLCHQNASCTWHLRDNPLIQNKLSVFLSKLGASEKKTPKKEAPIPKKIEVDSFDDELEHLSTLIIQSILMFWHMKFKLLYLNYPDYKPFF